MMFSEFPMLGINKVFLFYDIITILGLEGIKMGQRRN